MKKNKNFFRKTIDNAQLICYTVDTEMREATIKRSEKTLKKLKKTVDRLLPCMV